MLREGPFRMAGRRQHVDRASVRHAQFIQPRFYCANLAVWEIVRDGAGTLVYHRIAPAAFHIVGTVVVQRRPDQFLVNGGDKVYLVDGSNVG